MAEAYLDKTGLQIDLPSCDGGTTSTGSIARKYLLDCKEFLIGLPQQ